VATDGAGAVDPPAAGPRPAVAALAERGGCSDRSSDRIRTIRIIRSWRFRLFDPGNFSRKDAKNAKGVGPLGWALAVLAFFA